MLLWGLGLGAGVTLEKLVRDRCLAHAWAHRPVVQRGARLVGPAYVFAAITLSLHPVWRFLL